MPMLGSLVCSSLHRTPPSCSEAVGSILARARSCRDEDLRQYTVKSFVSKNVCLSCLLTLFENLPFPVDLAFLLRVDEAGSTDSSYDKRTMQKL